MKVVVEFIGPGDKPRRDSSNPVFASSKSAALHPICTRSPTGNQDHGIDDTTIPEHQRCCC
jgi:hypothetical protein